MTAGRPIEPTGSFTDLALHALAHLRVPGHTSVYDSRYVHWARTELPADAVDPIAADADLLASLHAAEPGVESLHALPLLFDELERVRAVAARPLLELGPEEVTDAAALAALRTVDERLVEILWADIALAAPAYADAWTTRIRPILESACESVRAAFESACALMPSLLTAQVELAHPLGPRGRVAGDRIVVGAPAPWNAMGPETSVVLAMHERAASLARGGWAEVEWSALREVARRMLDAPATLADAHARWLASLDVDGLADAVLNAGLADESTARALRDPDARLAVLHVR